MNRPNLDPGERERISSLYDHERELWNLGLSRVAGVDEAGRGPLAGPVMAAAVIFPGEIFIPGIKDSKLLSPSSREALHDRIFEKALSVGIGQACSVEIDQHNILQASFLAMRRAVSRLTVNPEFILVDGLWTIPELTIGQRAIVRGDQTSFSIAAASIIAKVHRDRLMQEYHLLYPQYCFDRHKGYPTRDHIAAIEKYGLCQIHRRSFKIRTTA